MYIVLKMTIGALFRNLLILLKVTTYDTCTVISTASITVRETVPVMLCCVYNIHIFILESADINSHSFFYLIERLDIILTPRRLVP